MNNLVVFNKEGDALNLNYDTKSGTYNGTLNFDENGSDTFKTIGLYMFQKVDSFEFDSIDGDANLQKFQLFNENRFTFTGNSYFTQSVLNIESVNNNSEFFSKWIYGVDFEKKFPIGNSILFNSPIFEFTNLNNAYTIVSSKKNAIMIISTVDNKSFTTLYSGLTFSNITISGLNSVGIYDYRRGLIDKLSSWSEPDFYTKIYDNKKLTIIGGTNSKLVTINNINLHDKVYNKYNITSLAYTQSSDLNVFLTFKSDLPNVYTGNISINSNKIYFSNKIPSILKPNTEFIISDSPLNKNTIIVDNITNFLGNVNIIFYPTASQVLYNNTIYQCTNSYTQSLISSITPIDTNYWTSSISYLPSKTLLNNETLLNATVHLTTNKILYTQNFTYSNSVTMASFVEKYKSEFDLYNINLYYEKNKLNSDLIYSSKYAEIDYLIGTNSITNEDRIVENIFQTKEILTNSVDNNISSNYKYSMVISDIDSFGIKLNINGHIYQENTEFVYNGLDVDLKKSIDKTLRNLLYKNFARLSSIGVDIILESNIYSSEFDFYKDTIVFKTHYPNVPLHIIVNMGSTANYYIKHSKVIFDDIGAYFSININGKEYGQKVTSSTSSVFIPDINLAISNWVDKYYDLLFGYGIFVSNVRGNLYFNLNEPNTRLKYTIKTNKLVSPGINQYKIEDYIEGKFGTLIVGNQIVLSATSSQNFEEAGFSTGMITSINNTIHPYDNQEYNLIYVDNNKLGLSYQGPFWSTYDRECNVSAFTTLAFSPLSYGVTACPVITITSSIGGEFVDNEFDPGFSLSYVYLNDYDTYNINIGSTNLTDMLYINEFGKIYTLGTKIGIIDASTFELTNNIEITGFTYSSKLVYNSYNKYIYAVLADKILVIDPVTESIYSIINEIANDILINQNNGDVYISYNTTEVHIYHYNNFTSIYNILFPITNLGKLEFNILSNNVYAVGDMVYEINSITYDIINSFNITDLNNNFIYTEPINGSIYVWGDTLYKINDGSVISIPITNSGNNKIIFDNFTNDMFISQTDFSNFIRLSLDDEIKYTQMISFGDMVVGQYDGDIYMISSIGRIYIIDALTGYVKYTNNLNISASKIIYNPLRDTVIIMGNSGVLYEFSVTLNTKISLSSTMSTPSSIGDGLFGSLSKDYVPKTNIWLKTREYLRYPRENYSDDNLVKFVWKFEDDSVPDIFMYDLTGEQLIYGSSYSYTGELPLNNPVLNKTPNKDLTKLNDSSYQQTVFSEIQQTLKYLDSNDVSIMPTPIEIFIGYNSNNEGYVSSTLKLYKRENVTFSITYNSTLNNLISFIDLGLYGIIQMDNMSSDSFVYYNDVKRGFKIGQLFKIEVSDVSNTKNKYISYNNGKIFKIREIYNTQIVVDYISDSLVVEDNLILNYPKVGINTSMKIKFTVIDKEILSLQLFGQTEIEDIRYKMALSNVGQNISPSDTFIFKSYDINEQGVDWEFLNKKRKELLLVRHDIFPYIGSYKAIINAINYFGYNDLELYEYYRNINLKSPDFYKLFKVEIPDIFDNTVEGFTVNDFIKHTMPNPNFEETNLFNLTYKITDKQGNNVLMYSLQEVIIKLQGLKKWLSNNVVPISHKIIDITGRTDFVGGNYLTHRPFYRKSFKINESMSPIDFSINEAYLMPVNSGSTVYNVVVDFYTSNIVNLPENFNVTIRTYKTYLEWNPFTTYSKNDEVIYYGNIYQSIINSNRILDPRKYDKILDWKNSIEYFDGQLATYNRHTYEYLGTESSYVVMGTNSNVTPYNSDSWLDISEWVKKDLVPVQTIFEYGNVTYSNVETVNNYLFYPSSVTSNYIKVANSYNFAIDSNIDPFITICVSSNNGYGAAYTSKKNYEIRGENSLFKGVKNIEPIGPFIPIKPVTNMI